MIRTHRLLPLLGLLALAVPPFVIAEADKPQNAHLLLDRVARGGKPLTDAELSALLQSMPPQEVDVNLVMVSAVVTDRRGRAIPGLAARDFTVTEEGQQRPLAWFSEEQGRSFRIVLLVDASGSMGGDAQLDRMRTALTPLAREVGVADRVKLVAFAGQRVVDVTDWTSAAGSVLEQAIAVPRGGKTALADALVMAASRLPRAPVERQAIVLVTDGLDNASQRTTAEAIDAARSIGVPVYVLALADHAQAIQYERGGASPLVPLRAIADQTGGRFFPITEPEEAAAAAVRVREDLRHQYWLAFSPSRPLDGSFRAISVDTRRPGTQVLARLGYR